MGAETATTFIGSGKAISLVERLRVHHQEKIASKAKLFTDYETTRDGLQEAFHPEMHAVFAEVFSPTASFQGAKETQAALTDITTNGLILDSIQTHLRETHAVTTPSMIFGSAASLSQEAMIEQKLSERALRTMQKEGVLAADDTIPTLQEGITTLVQDHARSLITVAKEKLNDKALPVLSGDSMKTTAREKVLHDALLHTLTRTTAPAVMETALDYLLKGDHPEIQTALSELVNTMQTSGATFSEHDHAVQTKLTALKEMVHHTLFSESLTPGGQNGKNGAPTILEDNEKFTYLRTFLTEQISQAGALAVRKNELTATDARTLQRQYNENEKGMDTFSRISKGAVAGGTIAMLLTPLLQACRGGMPPGTEPPPIPTGKPTDDHHESTPTPFVTPEITNTPPPIITGNLPDVTALSGLAPGVGGAGELVTNPFDSQIQTAINAAHFGVVHAGNAVSVESAHNGNDFCFSAIPSTIFDPDNVPGPEGDLLIKQENGVAKYGFNQVLAEVLVPPDTTTEKYSCALGYALDENPDFKDGTLRMILVRTNSNGTIDVVGSMQAGFSKTENVQVRDGVVTVNGVVQEWTLFPDMIITPPAPEYHIGLQADGAIALNHVDLSARFADANHDGIMDGLPPAQLAAEQTFLASHPEITGDNRVANSVAGQGSLPNKTLNIEIKTKNIITVNQDQNTPNLYEIVFVQKNPENTHRTIVHLIIDLDAQQHVVEQLNNPNFTSRLVFPEKLNEITNGNIDSFGVDIFMNSTANSDLVDDPAFARVRQVVEAEGADLRQLFIFTDGGYPDQIDQQVAAIDSSQFVSAYAIIP